MKKLPVILLFLLAGIAATAQPRALRYSFTYDTLLVKPRMIVTLSFRGDSSGRTELQLPDAWANQKELYKAVSHLEAVTPGVRIDTTADPARRLLQHAPGAELTLAYELRQDWSGTFVYPKNYRAVLQPTWMQSTGYALLARPSWDKEAQVALTLDWSGMPQGWAIANSFHAGNRSYTGRCRVGDLENSFWAAGDFRLLRQKVHGKPVYIAVRGKWVFTDRELQERALRIIGAERAFWQDHTEPHFLLSLVPFTESGHFNGSALHQSFFMGMSTDSMASGQLTKLLAHEYMHRWIGGKLQLAGREEAQYWFSEGFTEYYTYKMLHKSGFLTLPGYLGAVNRMLAEYYRSPVRAASQQASADSFWLAPAFQRLPYTKGFAYALYLDASMQERGSGSLDKFLFELLKGKGDSTFVSGQRFNALLQAKGIPADSLQQAWIASGGIIPVKALPIAAGYPLQVRELASFELGFDAGTLKKGAPIGGVQEGSAAWDAGLRNGMLAESYSIYYDQPNQPVVIGVRDGGEARRISYLPKKKQTVPVPQYAGVDD